MLSDDRQTITIRGNEYRVKKIYPPRLSWDKKAYVQVIYYKKRNQLVWTTESIHVRVCRFCDNEYNHHYGGSAFCSESCKNKHYAREYNIRKEYIELVPDYLKKYMVVVEDGETWKTEDQTRL